MMSTIENKPSSQQKELAPFSLATTPQLPELLFNLKCSIAISTYQAGKLIFISAKDENNLTQLPRTFDKPMGFHVDEDRMVLATKDEVILFQDSKELAKHYPNKPDTYDSMFLPKAAFYTGQVDIHDVEFGDGSIWAINTSFSCICQFDGYHNFVPVWKPSFITDLVSEDRCHLNGLVMVNGKPKFVTALGAGDTHQSWREDIVGGGVLIDVETDEIILEGLAMPHSPMMHKGELYMLLSATGELVKVNVEQKSYEVLKSFNAFVRGMDIIGDHAFIATSKLRKNSSTFAKLPFAETADTAGVIVVHLPTMATVGELKYQSSVDEIYALKIIPNSLRPNIVSNQNPLHKSALSIPGKTFWAKTEQPNMSNLSS